MVTIIWHCSEAGVEACLREGHAVNAHGAWVTFTMFYILYFIMLKGSRYYFFFESIHWLSRVTSVRVMRAHMLSEIWRASYVWQKLWLLLRIQFMGFSPGSVALLEFMRVLELSGAHILVFELIIFRLKLVVVTLSLVCLFCDYTSRMHTFSKAGGELGSPHIGLLAMSLDHRGLVESKLNYVHASSHFLLLLLDIELL